MRGMIALTIALAWGAGWATADPKPKASPKVDPKLVGLWVGERFFHGKTEMTDADVVVEYEFKADGTWIMRRNGKDYAGGPGRFATDTTVSPAQIDTIRDPDHPAHRSVSQGIYKIEGDTLTIRKQGRGEVRPASFDGELGDGSLSIWKRATKKDGAAGPKEVPKPDPKLLGRWAVVRTFTGDTETTTDKPRVEYEFKADGKFIYYRDGKESPRSPGTFTTDPKATPARIDLVLEMEVAERKVQMVSQGIYKIEGDTLTVRTAERGEDRPTAFEGPGRGYRVILKRVKKD